MLEIGKCYCGWGGGDLCVLMTIFRVIATNGNWVKAQVWDEEPINHPHSYRGEVMLSINQFTEINEYKGWVPEEGA